MPERVVVLPLEVRFYVIVRNKRGIIAPIEGPVALPC